MQKRSAHPDGFTLIELTVVMLIIIILMALVFTGAQGMIDRAKKTQAKNDLTQIVTAVNAFYTEYGTYPLAAQGSDFATKTDNTINNSGVINALRASAPDSLNTRKIVFFSPRVVTSTPARGAVSSTNGICYDPWGNAYQLGIDGDYNNSIPNPYTSTGGAGPQPLPQSVIAWSLGKDGQLGKVVSGQTVFTGSDDVISWQ